MAQTTLYATEDTHLDDESPDANAGGINDLDIGEYNAGTIKRRALIQFDLSGLDVISVVKLRLYHAIDFADNTRTIRVYRCKRNWGELTATWNNYDGSNPWQTVGADGANDRESADIGSLSIAHDLATGDFIEITLNAAAVEAMRTGAFTNNGFVVRMDTESDDMHRYHAREAANDPQLVVTHAPAVDVVENPYSFIM